MYFDLLFQNSFADIARLLSEFFRDLDVVPSDVLVGLVLLRKRQQLVRLRTVHQPNNPVNRILSGVRVTPQTKFLEPGTSKMDWDFLSQVRRFMLFAIGVYGWPMYLRRAGSGALAVFNLCHSMNKTQRSSSIIEDDNCCGCNLAAYDRMVTVALEDDAAVTLVYITYHVDVGETPFMVAVDRTRKAIVVSIRGTLSLKVRTYIALYLVFTTSVPNLCL